jgi:hypothetical protein
MTGRSMGEIIRDQRPLAMGPDATVAEACAAMHKRRVGAVLVVTSAPGSMLAWTKRRGSSRSCGEAAERRSGEPRLDAPGGGR